MEQYKTNNAAVRIHSETGKETIEAATMIFMRKVQRHRKKEKKQ